MARKSNNSALNALAVGQNSGLLPFQATNTVEFDGGTTDAIGDDGGALDPYTLFTVTGTVVLQIIGICTDDLDSAGGGKLEVGTELTTAGLIAQTTATDIDENDIWHDASPDASVEAIAVMSAKIVSDDVILTTSTANVTDGTIVFYCMWAPLSQDGNVE